MEILLQKDRLPEIRTKRLLMRDIQVSDISEEYVNWLNDPDVNKYLEVRHSTQSKETVTEFVISKLENYQKSKHFGVYLKDRLIGTVSLPQISQVHKTADISFVIGLPEAYGRGYATEAVGAVVSYSFEYGGLEKLWAGYKYLTVVGEQGVQLSGGQRQRIGIARALYNDPEVLVFDEATSALDGVTETAIMDAVNKFNHEKTIIMVAHRLTTVKECDVIYFFEKGKIVDCGTYDDLIERNKAFKNMAKTN